MTYYDRTTTEHVDGTPIFKTQEDEISENEIAALLGETWGCEIRSFGRFAPVDWFSVRDGRVSGVLELKSRSHESTRFDTVFLNVRKWLALQLASTGMAVPAIFVVRFTDVVLWVSLSQVPVVQISLKGCKEIVKSRNDIEPIIEVPISRMRPVVN